MKNLIIAIITLFSIGVFSQNRTKYLDDFSQIKVFDGISVKLIKADENRAEISGKYAKNVTIVNKNGLLKIRLDIDKSFRGEDTYVSLYYKDIYLIDANEKSYVFSEETISSIDLDIKAQEGAEIKLDVRSKRLNIRAISGGKIKLTGRTKNQDVVINSGGMYRGKELVTEQAQISVSAGGVAKIYATDIVKATVRAGGNIRIYGNPKVVDEKKVLGGTITIVE